MSSKLEPAIWSHDTGQWILYPDRFPASRRLFSFVFAAVDEYGKENAAMGRNSL